MPRHTRDTESPQRPSRTYSMTRYFTPEGAARKGNTTVSRTAHLEYSGCGSRSLAQPRQDLGAVQVEETRLIGPGGVEDEVGEPEVDVAPDRGDVLVRIGGHDEPAGGPVDRQRISTLLHLDRVLDAGFLLRRQRKCPPVLAVRQRAATVRVEGHLHLDLKVEIGQLPAASLRAFLQGGQQRLGVQLWPLTARRDVAVAFASGKTRRRGSRPRDVQRDWTFRPIVDGGVPGAVVGALVGNALVAPQHADDRHGFPEPGETLLRVRPVDAERHLVQRLTGADAEHHAIWEQEAEGAECLGDQGGVIAKRRSQHARAEDDPVRAPAKSAQPGQRERCVPAVVPPRLQVIADEYRVESDRFCEHREVEELGRAELLGGRLVSEPDHAAPIGPPGESLPGTFSRVPVRAAS